MVNWTTESASIRAAYPGISVAPVISIRALQRERVGGDDPVELDVLRGRVGGQRGPGGRGEVRRHVHVEPEARPAVLVVVLLVVGVRGRHAVFRQIGQALDRKEIAEGQVAVAHRRDRVRTPETSGPTQLGRVLGHEEIPARTVGAHEMGEGPEQVPPRLEDPRCIRRELLRVGPAGGRGAEQKRRRGRPHDVERRLSVGGRVVHGVGELVDGVDRERSTRRGKGAEPVRQIGDGLGHRQPGIGEPAARGSQIARDVDVSSHDGDAPDDARDPAARPRPRPREMLARLPEVLARVVDVAER